MHRLKTRSSGMTLAEVMVAIAILGMLVFASYSLTTGSQQLTKLNMDRQFATQKAISIMEELRSVAQAATGPASIVLDTFDDGTNTPEKLTIQPVSVASDRRSGNVLTPDGRWLYRRKISVQRIAGQSTAGVRLVRVTIYRDEDGTLRPEAEVASIIRTLANTAPPSQVYDVYAIAINNVPGWWVYTANLVPFVQNAVSDLSSRNPGLQFRVHWITKLAYGRDEQYRPFVNKENPSTDDINWVYFYPGALPLNDSTRNPPNLAEYYPTSGFAALINIDGTPDNNYSATSNPFPISLADQYNHAKRFPDEALLYAERKNATDGSGNLIYRGEEPTLRLLLDDMVMNPAAYTNAILINLHGELFPFPPFRNYSDPAKAPDVISPYKLANLRAVTHPEKIAYNTTDYDDTDPNQESNDIKLRVYTYETWDQAAWCSSCGTPGPVLSGGPPHPWFPVPVTVLIKGVEIASSIQVDKIEGGTDQRELDESVSASVSMQYRMVDAIDSSGSPPANEMYATVANVDGDTLIKLYNSPFRTDYCQGTSTSTGLCGDNAHKYQGLHSTYYLYNMQYIPSPTEDVAGGNAAFNRDLTYNSDVAKNTARWVITLPWGALNNWFATQVPPMSPNQVLQIETRIGEVPSGQNEPTTGVLYPTPDQPANLSRTYVWRGTDAWLYGDGTDANAPHLPMSERFQFLGDPRHSPYADLKKQYSKTAGTMHRYRSPLGESYNRNFDDFEDSGTGNDRSGDWIGYTATIPNDGNTTNDGWSGGGEIEADIDRAFQILRTSLTASRAVYTTMTGYSYYYFGLGGEIGYDSANLFPNSIPISSKPFTGSSGSTYEQSIIEEGSMSQGPGVKYVREVGDGSTNGSYWWSMNWLGELYPDDEYSANWATNGNLPTGTTPSSFRRVLRGLINPSTHNSLPRGTDFIGTACSGCDNTVRRTGPKGCTDFFWTGSSGSTFHHTPNTSNADVTAEGLYVAGAASGYNFPLLTPIPNNRPFNLNVSASGDNPETFLQSRYGGVFTTREEARYYRNQGTSGPGSSLISLRNPDSNRVAFIVVNGLSPVGESGTDFIARWSFLSLIHSYLEGGLYTDSATCTGCPFRIVQLPRVNITYPNSTSLIVDPSTINITWDTTWKRWDDKAYTPEYASNFAETATMDYQVMYSTNNGVTWKFVQDDSPATPGTKLPDGDSKLLSATSYSWSTPSATFPQQNYIIRVEAYRQGFPLHYSYHQFTAFIRRTS